MRNGAIYLKVFPRPNEEKRLRTIIKMTRNDPSFNIDLTTS